VSACVVGGAGGSISVDQLELQSHHQFYIVGTFALSSPRRAGDGEVQNIQLPYIIPCLHSISPLRRSLPLITFPASQNDELTIIKVPPAQCGGCIYIGLPAHLHKLLP
jgi:hypothetical protein